MPIEIPTIQVQPDVANALWILGVHTYAPSPNAPVNVVVTVCPKTVSGSLLLDQRETFTIQDVVTKAQTTASYATALTDIYTLIQGEVNARGLYATASAQDTGSANP